MAPVSVRLPFVSQRRVFLLLAGVILTTMVVAHTRSLFLGDTFAGRDHLTHSLPAKAHLASALAELRIPQWWDQLGLGVPFAANPNHSVLYPPAWLVAVLPMPWAVDFLLLLHLAIAGLGVAMLSRRFGADPVGGCLAGCGFAVCGLAASTVVHGGPALTLAWAPWVVWAGDRVGAAGSWQDRWQTGVGVTVFTALALLAGDPSIVITTSVLALGVVAARSDDRLRSVLVVVGAQAAAVLLAAVVVVPALLAYGESARAAGDVPPETWSMHPWRLVELWWPGALGDANTVDHHAARAIADASLGQRGLSPSWALSVYVSVPVLLFASLAVVRHKRNAGLAVLAFGFLVLAAGDYVSVAGTSVYDVYRFFVLPERMVRYPEKHVLGFVTIAFALAGVGMTQWFARPASRPATAVVLATLAVVAIAVLSVHLSRDALTSWLSREAATAGLRPTLESEALVGDIASAGWTALMALALVTAGLALARNRRFARFAAPGVAAVAVGHLVGHGWEVLPTVDREAVSSVPEILTRARPSDAAPSRIYRDASLRIATSGELPVQAIRRHHTAIENTATRFGFAHVPGYDQAQSARFRALWYRAGNTGQGARMVDLFDVEYIALSPSTARGSRMPIVATTEAGDVSLVRNRVRRPRAFVATQWRWLPSDKAAAEAILPDDPRTAPSVGMVHLTGEGVDGMTDDDDGARDRAVPTRPCDVDYRSPERFVLTCVADGEGYVVMLDAWAPGWTVRVNGEVAELKVADGAVRAVRVAAGTHHIEFSYQTPGLRLGAIVSALAWANLLVAVWLLRRKRRRRAVRP